MHRRRADIAGLAGLNDIDIVERFERLLDRRVIVPSMDLVEVDVIGAEAPQARVDLGHDPLARQAGAIGSRPHPAIDLGSDDDLVSSVEILDRTPENLLAAAERIAVRRVEEIDAGFERTLDERAALLLAEAPGMIAAVAAAVAHAAQANPRHVEAGAAELGVFHRRSITPLPVDHVTQRFSVTIGAEIVAEDIHTAVAAPVAAV
jgi:hypothetical protein